MDWLDTKLQDWSKPDLEALHLEVFGEKWKGRRVAALRKKMRQRQLAQIELRHQRLLKEFDPFGSARFDMETLYRALAEDVGDGWREVYKDVQKPDCKLQFGAANTKLSHLKVITLSLPAAYSCPSAGACRTRAELTGKETKSGHPARKVRLMPGATMGCFAAALSARKPLRAAMEWRNFLCLRKHKTVGEYVHLIQRSLDAYGYDWNIFRFHDSGDFFNQKYLDAWVEVARAHPNKLFYGYTTSLYLWMAAEGREPVSLRDDQYRKQGAFPRNMHLVASTASKQCHLIAKHRLRYSNVFSSVLEVVDARMAIDVNEWIPAFGREPFGLLLHGSKQETEEARRLARYNQTVIKQAAEAQAPYLTSRVIENRFRSALTGHRPVESDFRRSKTPWIRPEWLIGMGKNYMASSPERKREALATLMSLNLREAQAFLRQEWSQT